MNPIKFEDVSDFEFQAKFWRQVQSNGPCWEWCGGKRKSGYGIIVLKGKPMLAHRISFVMAYGGISERKLACHTCDNPSCVNPLHLYEGTDKDNVADCISRGRRNSSGMRRLTSTQVIEIRTRYNERTANQSELAQEFGIWHAAIGAIVRGETYKNIPGPISPRRVRGSNVLSDSQINEIRTRYSNKTTSIAELAKEFGFATSVIHRIVIGETYRNSPGPISVSRHKSSFSLLAE